TEREKFIQDQIKQTQKEYNGFAQRIKNDAKRLEQGFLAGIARGAFRLVGLGSTVDEDRDALKQARKGAEDRKARLKSLRDELAKIQNLKDKKLSDAFESVGQSIKDKVLSALGLANKLKDQLLAPVPKSKQRTESLGAFERGSVEAFQIIAGVQGDKMFRIENEQLKTARNILEEERRMRRAIERIRSLPVANL